MNRARSQQRADQFGALAKAPIIYCACGLIGKLVLDLLKLPWPRNGQRDDVSFRQGEVISTAVAAPGAAEQLRTGWNGLGGLFAAYYWLVNIEVLREVEPILWQSI